MKIEASKKILGSKIYFLEFHLINQKYQHIQNKLLSD